MTLTPLRSDRDSRRDTILKAARELFLEYGFTCTTMAMIAARLGGSKAMIYSYFRNKEDLFAAHVADFCRDTARDYLNSGVSVDPTRWLTQVGFEYLQRLFSEQATQMHRVLIAEAQRDPTLGRLFYELGPAKTRAKLQKYLEQIHSRGSLDIPDCKSAAEQFLNMCEGGKYSAFLLRLIDAPNEESIKEQVRRAVDSFLVLYRVKSSGEVKGVH
jgi:TetR/AcrR family transcriptional repressor of mexJK operon